MRGGSHFCQSPKGGGSGVFLIKHKGGPTLFWGKIPKFTSPPPPPPPPKKKTCLPLVCAGLKTDTCSFGTFSLMIVHETRVTTFYPSFLYFALSLSMHRALIEQVKQSKYCLIIYKLYIYIFFLKKVITFLPSGFPNVRHTLYNPQTSGNDYIYLKKKSAKVKRKQSKKCSNTAVLKYGM